MRFPALDKHLCNRGCKAKVPIDLERWVCTQHIGINAASHTGNIFLLWYNGAVFSKAPVHVPRPGVWPRGMPSMPCTIRSLRPRAFPVPPGRLPEAPGKFSFPCMALNILSYQSVFCFTSYSFLQTESFPGFPSVQLQ